MTLTSLGSTIDIIYMAHGTRYFNSSSLAVQFLSFFFYSCTFAAAVFIAAFHEFPEGESSYPPLQTGVLEEPDKQPRY